MLTGAAQTRSQGAMSEGLAGLAVGTAVDLHSLSRPELNGCRGEVRGHVVAAGGEPRCKVAIIGGGHSALSIKPANLKVVPMDHHDRLVAREHRVAGITALDAVLAGLAGLDGLAPEAWARHGPDTPRSDVLRSSHWAEGSTHLFTSVADAIAVLADEAKRKEVVRLLAEGTYLIGRKAQMATEIWPITQDAVVVSSCLGCNLVFDQMGGCAHTHQGAPPHLELGPAPGSDEADGTINTKMLLHKAVASEQLVLSLLTWERPECPELGEAQDMLLNALAEEGPPGADPARLAVAAIMAGGLPSPLFTLVGVVDNCPNHFPKAAHLAIALLSLIVAARPAAAFAQLDADVLVAAIDGYLRKVARSINDAACQCTTETYYGVTFLLNAVPLLYLLGDWPACAEAIANYQLPAALGSMAVNVLHQLDRDRHDDDTMDRPLDEHSDPTLRYARVYVAPLFGDQPLVTDRPYSMLTLALVEVLGRWSQAGIQVSEARIPCGPADDEPLSATFEEYRPAFGRLIDSHPELAGVGSIVDALVAGRRPRKPRDSESLLRGPLLHRSLKCGLRSCGRTTALAGGRKLSHCGGNCRGLARYCCPEHQREHWKHHKFFCKRQPSRPAAR